MKKDKLYYKKLGWLFDKEIWYDGHNNDRNVSLLFKSPRMCKFFFYSDIDSIEYREAFAIAWSMKDDFELKNLLPNALTEYFLKNPDKTNPPKIKILIDEN